MSEAEHTLLIVDDDAITRRAMCRTLEDPDYNVLQAAGPAEALELLSRHHIEVVISDFHMPSENGAQFLAAVKVRCPNTVRVLLTSDTSSKVLVSAINDGQARRVLYKPWTDEQLRNVVRQSFGLPRRGPNRAGVYTLKQPTNRTLTRIAALLGVERVE